VLQPYPPPSTRHSARSPWKTRALKTLWSLMLASAFLLASLPAAAVELTGQIRGVVVDTDGLAVPSVELVLTSEKMQGDARTNSGPDGQFRFVGLPVGEYRLQASMAGFQPKAITVRVAAGLSANVDVELSTAMAGEELIVEEEAAIVDVTSTRTGAVLTKEMLRDIPNAGRDYQGATALAAGVVSNGSGNPNMRGGLSYGNQYYVDGVNTTDPLTNTFSMNMNFDAIEEVQVITGGMDAEYGRAMGGAVNVVTRSGGNEFHGDVQVLYNNTAMQVYQPLPEEEGQEDDVYDDFQLAINLGGPIKEDKLWFFTSFQMNRVLSTLSVPETVTRPEGFEQMQTERWASKYLFGKITWKPNADHRVWVHAQTDPTNIDNAEGSYYTLPNAETWWQQGGWLASLGHQWTPGSQTIVDAQLSTSRTYINYMPIQWRDCTEWEAVGQIAEGNCTSHGSDLDSSLGSWVAYDYGGFSYGEAQSAYYTRRARTSFNAAITRFASLMGDHQMKLGLQSDFLGSYSIYEGYDTGEVAYQHDGDPTNLEGYTPAEIFIANNKWESELGGALVSVYLQDAWQPVSRLTLRPGLRLDNSRFTNNIGEVVIATTTLSPRFGAAFDLTGDQRTSLYAYYGRFYDSGFLEIADLLSKENGGGAWYPWADQAGDWSDTASYGFGSEFLVHEDLRVPYSDEFDVGLNRDLGGGWAAGVNFTYEMGRNLFEDDEVNLIWNDDGTAVIGSRDGTGLDRYRLRTPDEAFVNYTALEFTAEKAFEERWGLLASYTWSRAYGRERDDLTYGLASGTFDIAPQQEYEVGLMPYDIPHSIKIAGSMREPNAMEVGTRTALGYIFGWNFTMRSGWPYRPVYFNPYYYGWYNSKETIDGSYRLPAVSSLDLKTGLTIAQGVTTWDLTLECFNVLNDRTVTWVETAADDETGGPYTDDDGNVLFGSPLSRQSPRFFQIGLRGEF